MEEENEAFAFWVILEIGLEDVLDVGWVGGDDAVDVSWTVEDRRVCRAIGEDSGCPLKKAVPVNCELG